MRLRVLALAALLAASTASADWPEIVSSWHEIQNPAAVLAPPTCTAPGQVGVFLGSPLALGCDPSLTYTTATKTLNAPTVAANNLTATALATPTITSVTPVGTTGAVTYGYKVVAYLADGTSTAASAESTTATGNATLDGTNFNRVVWPAVTGATSYRLYRTTGGAAPPKLIYTGAALTFDDTTAASTSETPATANGTGRVLVGDGTATKPGMAFANYPTTGVYAGASYGAFSVGGASAWTFTSGQFRLPADTYSFSFGASNDLILSRAAAATLQLGAANAASPVAQTLKVQDCTGSNCNGAASFKVQAPAGRGTGTRGKFVFQTPQVAASGDNAQTQADRLSIAEAEVTTNIGTGTATARVGGVLNVNTTAQATTGTSEEVLATYTMPANTLARDGQAVRITAFASTAANANNKTFRIRVGGVGGTQVTANTATVSAEPLNATVLLVRTGATTQKAIGSTMKGTALATTITNPTATLSGAVDIVVTGQTATAAGDITFEALIVEALN